LAAATFDYETERCSQEQSRNGFCPQLPPEISFANYYFVAHFIVHFPRRQNPVNQSEFPNLEGNDFGNGVLDSARLNEQQISAAISGSQ
jgi:hypothetical protein